VDGFRYDGPPVPPAQRPEIDRWILSALHSLMARYTEAMESYDVTRAARMISDFTIDQLSNWYVRRNRRRFWKSEPGPDKTAAYQTLYECLLAVAKLMAPFAPFLADELYRNLSDGSSRKEAESVHLAMLPVADTGIVNAELERRMERAERIVMLVRAMRTKSNLKVRQPLSRIILPIASEEERNDVRQVEDIILDEVNVKTIEYVTDDSGLVKKRAKPNFKAIGPKFGKISQQVAGRVKELTADDIRVLETDGTLAVSLNGSALSLGREDVEIVREDIEGWLVESDGGLTAALDTHLTEALVAEGNAREFVNRVQNMRKDARFQVTDRIGILVSGPADLVKSLTELRAYIMAETLAEEFGTGAPKGDLTSTTDINGQSLSIGIERRR
jgi:isoleucyl-tRNA synthetase